MNRRRDRDTARRHLGLPLERSVVAVTGGSLGARRINLAVLTAVKKWSSRRDLAVHHVVGRRDWPLVSCELPSPSDPGVVYQAVEYEERMDLVLAAADLVVCRAGATTVAEIAAVGLPSVIVPLPGAPGDHQTANGRYLAAAGAAVLIPDGELDGDRLVEVVDQILDDPQRLKAMGEAAASCGRRDAAAQVVALLEEHARDGP